MARRMLPFRVYERGGRWWVAFTARPGEYVRTSTGLKVGVVSRTDAVAEAQRIYDRRSGQRARPVPRQLRAVFVEFLDDKRHGARPLRARSLDSYRLALDHFEGFLRETGVRRLRDFDAEHVSRFRQWRARQGAQPGTIDNNLVNVRTFLNWCVRRGYLDSQPLRGLRRHESGEDTPRCLSDDEWTRLLEEAARDPEGSGTARAKVKKQPPDLTAGEFNRREC